MQRLIEGAHRFRREDLGRYRALFRRLSREGQNPHTLFITCADSRVLAELITRSDPGDLFVVKNVGNIVPPAEVVGSTNSTAAAIEFAVSVLRVRDIVVCGHSHCGAVAAFMRDLPDGLTAPHLRAWLQLAQPVRDLVDTNYTHLTDPAARLRAAEEENVLFALDNLRTYPAVQAGLAEGSLHLHGWFFKISSAELFAYDPDTLQFAPLVPPSTEPPAPPDPGPANPLAPLPPVSDC